MTVSHGHQELPGDMDVNQFLEWFSLFSGRSSTEITLFTALAEDLGFDSIELFELAVVLSGDDADRSILKLATLSDAFDLYMQNSCRSER